VTTFRKALRSALTEALDLPSGAPGGSHKPHKAPSGSIRRQSAGVLTELVSPPILECPHCHKPLPRPETRARRLVDVVTPSGKVLATEID